MLGEPATLAEVLLSRADDEHVGLRFESVSWTYRELVEACSRRAAWLAGRRPHGRPDHVGVLLDNVPEFWMLLGAAALSGTTIVGVNPTRRGAALARDLAATDCHTLVTEHAFASLLEDVDPGLDTARIHMIDDPTYRTQIEGCLAAAPEEAVTPATTFMLIFTSGTTGAPKAVRMGHGRLTGYAGKLGEMFGLTALDVCYSTMPLFHSNAIVAGWATPLRAGATCVLRRRFSASAFLDDVRRYGATWCNYVGKPLSYVLATPERPDDTDNPLRIAFGNEAAPLDIERFARRFDCVVADGYGSTEGGIAMSRGPGTPVGSIGTPLPPQRALVLDPETGEERPRALLDRDGRLLNAAAAIGEIVNPDGGGGFEGYYGDPGATRDRVRDGRYWTGDLAYRDEEGWFYFAGRSDEWLRVDGENFGAAPVEMILARTPGVALVAVYAVPAPDAGDEVMAALLLTPGTRWSPESFAEVLAAQADLSAKWWPRFVRITASFPATATSKILKRTLRAEGWWSTEPDRVWWLPGRDAGEDGYRVFDRQAAATYRVRFADHGRSHLVP